MQRFMRWPLLLAIVVSIFLRETKINKLWQMGK
ncbi:hypothetical protein Odosp_3659 [Odoribacter splanchnicus DSM 20712]|uniref:Uncharacterized protein n=1 Tax=Odoribacter splanchnicus (strain ATCC 29572 / DSM 20712 / CIP 104287 / JCM 15291 / NCTC 10825 / 1651/6) TaxID=709991 RepID=F9Z3H5_ODOSD|nr:hypothetical protein Odosp_3659 [Odoribacter splanchnicus DSM 20712]SNV47268.1 Uncharacterised protein [Odoribacter splanchnicus]